MAQPKDTTRVFSSAAFPSERRAIQAAEIMAAMFAKNPKLRGMTIVVTDEDGNKICNIAVPSQH